MLTPKHAPECKIKFEQPRRTRSLWSYTRIIAAAAAIAALAFYFIRSYIKNRIYNDPAFAHGNGRLEATEVNIASKLSERIASITVNEGDFVKKGQVLMVLEAMKMENEIMAGVDGTVTSVCVAKGATVETGAVLCTIK